MIDLHAHLLPGIDDGAETMEQSLKLARIAVAEGIQLVAATPHHLNGRYVNSASDVEEAVQHLRGKLAEERIPLQLITGQEIRVTGDLWTEWEQGRLLTLGGSRYLLLELPNNHVPRGFADLIYEMTIQGLVPIIAHPERNVELADNPDLLMELVQLGAWGQVTSHSLNGRFGNRVMKTAMHMCKRNLIHIIASDAHDEVRRPFGMREAYARIEKELDKAYVRYYMDNAKAVVKNVPKEIRTPMKRKRWFGF